MTTPSEMKDRMLKLAQNENNIIGIYNYCDRWCERCAFTSRCLNFASSIDEPDPDGPELWAYLDNVCQATTLMLEEMIAKMNINPDEINNMQLPDKPNPKDHPLYKKVYKLSFTIHDWLKENKPGDPGVETEINTPKELLNPRFHDSIEVIYWYNFFISAKIFRALGGKNEDHGQDPIQNDSNGSAKIALVAIDRLIAAWSVVMENMKDHEDEILKFLIGLAEVRNMIELIFPNARKFVRPGFDQGLKV